MQASTCTAASPQARMRHQRHPCCLSLSGSSGSLASQQLQLCIHPSIIGVGNHPVQLGAYMARAVVLLSSHPYHSARRRSYDALRLSSLSALPALHSLARHVRKRHAGSRRNCYRRTSAKLIIMAVQAACRSGLLAWTYTADRSTNRLCPRAHCQSTGASTTATVLLPLCCCQSHTTSCHRTGGTSSARHCGLDGHMAMPSPAAAKAAVATIQVQPRWHQRDQPHQQLRLQLTLFFQLPLTQTEGSAGQACCI